jgi:hypothetical protein
VLVTARGDYRAELTWIDFHRLRVQRSRQSLPSIARGTVYKTRNAILFPAGADQPPIRFDGMELLPGHIVVISSGNEFHLRASAASSWGGMSLSPGDLAAAGRALVGIYRPRQ